MSEDTFEIFEGDLSPQVQERYQAASALAVDTETMGLIPHRDRLCLVQLCDPAGHACAVKITLGQSEAPRLQQVLEQPSVLKIFHFARFDVATLKYHLGIQVAPLFCTKIASKLARTYSPRHGLKELVNEMAGVELDKRAQSSDWGNAANLSAEQLAYAANDVRYLHTLKQELAAMLEREGRWELAQSCFNCVPVLVALDLLHYQHIFEH
ncbi:MAG: ribonuclease H-like domain-containing protein [Cyanobacteria bacterium P01_A01_bin.135]